MPLNIRRPDNPGRKPGVPNRATVELRQLFSQLINDPAYQRKLRADFRARKVHPLTESTVWAYHTGKPKTEIEISGRLELGQRFELEAELLRGLNLAQLERLAEESRQLIERAAQLAGIGRTLPPSQPLDIVVDALPDKAGQETPVNQGASDNRYFVNSAEVPNSDHETPTPSTSNAHISDHDSTSHE